jgi:hypothetical protein
MKLKPRIRWSGLARMWVCGRQGDAYYGWGATPRAAYNHWLSGFCGDLL